MSKPCKTRSANKCHIVSDPINSDSDDKVGQGFHIEPLMEMKFVISKGMLEGDSEMSHDEEGIDLQAGGEFSKNEDPEAAVHLIDDDKVDSEKSSDKSTGAGKGESDKKVRKKMMK